MSDNKEQREESPSEHPEKTTEEKTEEKSRPRVRRLSATSLGIALISSFFWAWFILSAFVPRLQHIFPIQGIAYSLYLFAILVAAGIVAIISFRHSSIAFDFLGTVKTELITVLLGTVGNVITLLGLWLNLTPIVIAGGALTGAVGMCYMLAWGRMYAPEGSRSACLSVTFAIALGAVLASIISMLSGKMGVAVTLILPEIIMGSLFLLRGMSESGRDDQVSDAENRNGYVNGHAAGDADIFVKPQTEGFGAKTQKELFGRSNKYIAHLSIPLFAGLALLGFAIGFALGETGHLLPGAIEIGDGGSSLPLTSTNLLVFGLIALFAWGFLMVFIHQGAIILTSGVMLGLAGFMIYPTILPQSLSVGLPYLIPLGFLSTFAVSWTMLTEVSYSTGHDVVIGLAAGLATVMVGAAAGDAIAVLLLVTDASVTTITLLQNIVGVAFMVAFVLILLMNSRLWNQVKENAFLFDEEVDEAASSTDEQAIRMSHDEQTIDEQAQKHGLTERETQVLRLLLMGRSRSRIAHALTLSENTVGTHVQHIYQKFGVHGLQELIDFVFTH